MGKIEADQPGGPRCTLKMQLAQGVIEGIFRHTVTDVLDDFEDDGEPYWDAEGLLHLPLRMLGTGLQAGPGAQAGCKR